MARKEKSSLNAQFLAAAKRGDFEAVLSLFSDGAELSACDAHGNSALHLAAREGLDLTVATLLDLGAEVNAVNRRKETPLMLLATHADAPEAVVKLLAHGGDIRLANIFGKTALNMAEAAHNRKVSSLLQRAHYEDAQAHPLQLDVSLQRQLRVKKPLTYLHRR